MAGCPWGRYDGCEKQLMRCDMNLSLKPALRQFVEGKLKSGEYASAEDVVEAGLAALRQQENWGKFEAGELDRLLAEGERSIRREGTVEAERVFAELRRRSRERKRGRKAG
jgi:putative addiction module CopG family antidote